MGFVSILAEEHKYNMFMPVAYTPDYFSEGYPTETDEWAENMDINEDYTSLGRYLMNGILVQYMNTFRCQKLLTDGKDL